MKAILTSQLLFLSVCSFSQKSDTLHWNKNRNLSFDDFKKNVPIDSSVGGMSTTHIELASPKIVENRLRYRVLAIFNKSLSGLAQKDTMALKHEQGHFDICEIGARKIRQYISLNDILSQNRSSSFSKKIDSLYKIETDMQNTYDLETIHGADKQQQKRWNEKIITMLNELNSYEQ